MSTATVPLVALGDCCDVVNGTTPKAGVASHWVGDIVWVTPTDLGQLQGIYIDQSARTISNDALNSHNLTLCPAGSVVLSSRAPIGHLAIASVPICTNQGCKTLVPHSGVKSEYLFYSLLRVVPKLQALGSGATFAEISKSQVESFLIPLPTLVEQERIVTHLTRALTAVEASRGAAEDRLAAAKSLPAAYLREVFEGPMSGMWEMRTLGEMVHGNGQYGTSRSSNKDGRGLAVLGMPNIHQGRIRWEKIASADLNPEETAKYRLVVGDILFNRTNSAELVGKTAVFDGAREAVFASYLIRYRAAEDLADPHFICSYINSRRGRSYIERHMTRAVGQVNISASTMHLMPIPCPPLAEQQHVATELSQHFGATELIVARCREELAAIEALAAAVLRSAFNGES